MSYDIFAAPEIVMLQSVKAVQDIFSIFGDLIEKLGIDFYEIHEFYGQQVMKSLDSHGFGSLKTLKLEAVRRNSLHELKKTFETVTALNFGLLNSAADKYENENTTLSQLFPSIEELRMNFLKEYDWVLFDGQFPSLTSVRIILGAIQKEIVDDQHVLNFFKLNPQINTLRIEEPNRQVLNAAKTLPNLNFVDIAVRFEKDLTFEGDSIQFINVKNVAMKIRNDHQLFGKISFNQVENLALTVDTSQDETNAVNWIEFISHTVHSNVKIFSFYISNLNEKELVTITEKLPHLETVHIECSSNFLDTNGIKQFIEKSKHLNSLDITAELIHFEHITIIDAFTNWAVTFSSKNSNWNRVQMIRK